MPGDRFRGIGFYLDRETAPMGNGFPFHIIATASIRLRDETLHVCYG